MMHSVEIEFGECGIEGYSEDKPLITEKYTSYDIDLLLQGIDILALRKRCEAVCRHNTFGVHRILGSLINHNTIAKILNERIRTTTDCTDHGPAIDFYVTIRCVSKTSKELRKEFKSMELEKLHYGQLVKIWWKFGQATHNIDKLIIQDGDYWYRMFGHFYWNTGKRK